MASWEELAKHCNAVAQLGAMLLTRHGRAYLGTVRAGGGPRIHPVCPLISGGHLLVGIIGTSPKHDDLLRDRRYVLHALPGPSDAEFWVQGAARPLSQEELTAWSARDVRLRVPEGDTAFELDIQAAHATTFTPGTDGLPVADRRCWKADVELVRT